MQMPETKQEWDKLKKLFLKKYKVEDSAETWTFILSQIQNVKMPKLQFSPDMIYAYYKRWKIAKVLQDEKTVYIMELQAKVEEKLKALAEQTGKNGEPSQSEHPEHMHSGPFYSEGDVPPLPETQEGMVLTSEGRRF